MSKTKKNIIASLILVFAITMLVGCGGGSEENVSPATPESAETGEAQTIPGSAQAQSTAPEVEVAEPELTEADRALIAAEEFLSGHLSLIGYLGFVDFNSGYAQGYDFEFFDGNFPELLFGFDWVEDWPSIVDRTGAIVRDVPFVITNSMGTFAAESFSLYDLNGDGIPVILIHYAGMSWMGMASFSILYQYIDGSYQPAWNRTNAVYTGRINGLFTDTDGSIIAYIGRLLFDTTGAAYYRLNFADNSMELELIAEYEFGWFFDHQTDEERIVMSGTNFHTGAEFWWDDWEDYETDRQSIPRTIPGAPDMVLTPIEPLTGLQDQIAAAIRQGLEGPPATAAADVTPPAEPPVQAAATDTSLVGRWRHNTQDVVLEFFADGTGSHRYRDETQQFNWSAANGTFRMFSYVDQDFGVFTINYRRVLRTDMTPNPYSSGYWIQFEENAFGGHENRYRRLDGPYGEIYGRWAWGELDVMNDEALFEVRPDGTGYTRLGHIGEFTWRIENGRFIRTDFVESFVDYSIEGATLTTFETVRGRTVTDTFTRLGSN